MVWYSTRKVRTSNVTKEMVLKQRLALSSVAMVVERCLRFLSMADITHAGNFAIGICVQSAFSVTTSISWRFSLEILMRTWDLEFQHDVTDAKVASILTSHSLGVLNAHTMFAKAVFQRLMLTDSEKINRIQQDYTKHEKHWIKTFKSIKDLTIQCKSEEKSNSMW